jgi:tRNA (Thr-GGU) A37 N-methylase
MDSISYPPIGIIRTPYSAEVGVPIQVVAAPEVRGAIELYRAYAEG